MKTVFTLALLLVATSIFLASCSQPLSTSSIKSQYVPATENVQYPNSRQESENEGDFPYAVVGFSPELPKNNEVKDTAKTITESYEETLLAESILKDDGVKNNNSSMHNSFSSDFSINSQVVNAESFDNTSNTQIVNYSGNSGQSRGRMPFWFLVLLAIFIPPLAVAIMYGITDKFWICLGLTFIFFIPGMIYALIQVFH